MIARLRTTGVAMHIPERYTTDNTNIIRNVTMPSLPYSGLSIRELDALFDQSPIGMVFGDRELRARRTNAAFRRLVGLQDEAILGRRPSEGEAGMDTALAERTVAEQVINRGVPAVDGHIEQTLAGERRALPWSPYRGKPVLARNRAEVRSQVWCAPGNAEALLARGVHTAMVVPLTARSVTLGVATLSRAEHPEPYDEADVRLVSDLASRAAMHIDNARLYTREHHAAVTLQRSLLPRDIPPVPGLDIAYRYQPASRAVQVGRDWFDVIALDRGQVALVVGDVTGHSIHPAADMGPLATPTAALARLGHPAEEIMAQLSNVVAAHGDEAGP